jgi:uncharacterized protein (DUF885 family)
VVTRHHTAADALAEEYLDELAALDPIEATFAGIGGQDGRMTDYGPTGHAERAALARSTLARSAEVVPVDDVDEVTLAALREQLGQVLERHDAGLDLADLNNIACPVQSIREVFDVSPTASVPDWEAIAERLHHVPRTVDGYAQSLRTALAEGWVPPRRQVLAAARQAAEFATSDGFFAAFVRHAATDDGTAIPGPLAHRLGVGADEARGAYANLATWLCDDLVQDARDDDAAGADVYSIMARTFLGAQFDLAETYSWGLDELANIEHRMADVARTLAPDATGTTAERVAAAVAALDADPARTVQGADAFRGWMQELSDSAVDALAGRHFDIADPLRGLVCRIAPSTAGGVYYTGPSEDFSRPGQMWWSVPPGVTAFSTWRETSTVYHEGVPGHHLQIGQAVHRSDSLNRWRRMGSWISGHGEGWALYAERLMEELGFLTDEGDLLGMLDAHALRASRVVVDIGVHLRLPAPAEVGGGTWDAAKAWTFLTAHTRMPEPSRRFELERYLGWPGQAIAYKVGERVWLGLRQTLAEREGDRFDLREFHRKALDLGSVGLDVLSAAVLGEPMPAGV